MNYVNHYAGAIFSANVILSNCVLLRATLMYRYKHYADYIILNLYILMNIWEWYIQRRDDYSTDWSQTREMLRSHFFHPFYRKKHVLYPENEEIWITNPIFTRFPGKWTLFSHFLAKNTDFIDSGGKRVPNREKSVIFGSYGLYNLADFRVI